jgi:hypothetical protein
VAARPGCGERLSAREVLMIRSSGHCEIMVPGCRYSADSTLTRVPGLTVQDADDACLLFVACRACESVLSNIDAAIARRLGYLVASTQDAAAAPFYWRQSRWIRLDGSGELGEPAANPHIA